LQVNNLDSPEPIITPAEAVRLCDRHLGIGGDGVIFVMRDGENYQMRIYNSDGTEPEVSQVVLFWLERLIFGYLACFLWFWLLYWRSLQNCAGPIYITRI